jgi:hypothetical protein
MRMMKTFEEAFRFVMDHKVCTVFGSKGSPYPSLWDNTELSEKRPRAGGWSSKALAVWDWKTRIPQTYPESVYYGKIKGGDAVLMEMRYFRQTHYPSAFQPVSELDELARQVYELIRLEPAFTGQLRKRAMGRFVCTKSQFDGALKRLQISLNIVRSNDPSLKNDYWLTMREVHLDLVHQHDSGSAHRIGMNNS